MFCLLKMTEPLPLLLFGLGKVIVCIYSKIIGMSNKYVESSFRNGFADLWTECIKLGYHIGIYTSGKENDAMNIINDKFDESVDFDYILTQQHCKNVNGSYIKCLDYIDTKKYQPVLIAFLLEPVDPELSKYTIRIPEYKFGTDNFDMMALYPTLKRIYQANNDPDSIAKIVKEWNDHQINHNNRDNDSCIIL